MMLTDASEGKRVKGMLHIMTRDAIACDLKTFSTNNDDIGKVEKWIGHAMRRIECKHVVCRKKLREPGNFRDEDLLFQDEPQSKVDTESTPRKPIAIRRVDDK